MVEKEINLKTAFKYHKYSTDGQQILFSKLVNFKISNKNNFR